MIYKTLVPQHGIEPRSALYKRAATPISYKGVTLVDPQGIEPCKAGLKVRYLADRSEIQKTSVNNRYVTHTCYCY